MNTSPVFTCAAYLNDKISQLRPSKSIEQIAREAGFKRSGTLEAVLAGQVALRPEFVFKLSRAIGCSAGELYQLVTRDWKLERSILPTLRALEGMDITESELQLLGLVRTRLAGRDLVITDEVVKWVETFPDEDE